KGHVEFTLALEFTFSIQQYKFHRTYVQSGATINQPLTEMSGRIQKALQKFSLKHKIHETSS
ncbi:MAG: hypothetical protein LUG54_10580, partial [Clostridiales bacterium]|nr:hypothetical protein [Clostridiales bacterium]